MACKFGKLETAVWRKRRGFDDDRVAGHDSRCNLSTSEMNWKVPWHNGSGDAERGISDGDFSFFVVFGHDVWDSEFGDFQHPDVAVCDFLSGSGKLESLV